ncbi:MAG: hypothetical protein LBT53_09060 [Puniceicoccales bacterium]|nr:hypothetical protein [Puniceicoccales bacterium]
MYSVSNDNAPPIFFARADAQPDTRPLENAVKKNDRRTIFLPRSPRCLRKNYRRKAKKLPKKRPCRQKKYILTA